MSCPNMVKWYKCGCADPGSPKRDLIEAQSDHLQQQPQPLFYGGPVWPAQPPPGYRPPVWCACSAKSRWGALAPCLDTILSQGCHNLSCRIVQCC